MTNLEIFPWYSILTRDLVDRAYKSSSELAWGRADALQVARLLTAEGHRILGIDTWLPTRPGPTPLIMDWSESHAMAAADFIKTFQLERVSENQPGLEPYFNFTARPTNHIP